MDLENFGKLKVFHPNENTTVGENKESVKWENFVINNNNIFLNGKQFSYLFWEGKLKISTFSKNETIYIVERNKVADALDYLLSLKGLDATERQNMITFWLSQLLEKKYCLFQFMNEKEYSKQAKLEIIPTPFKVIRIFMIFKTLDTWTETFQKKVLCKDWKSKEVRMKEFVDMNPLKNKFHVIEWGGANLNI